jgi:hypothetical protein
MASHPISYPLPPADMARSQDMNERKRKPKEDDDGSSDSGDDGFAHITPTASTHDLPKSPPTTTSPVEFTISNNRPRRSTAKYTVDNNSRHRGKRRQTERRRTEPADPKSSRRRRLQSPALVHNLPAQTPEVQQLVNGETTIDELHVEHPGRNSSLSVANLARQLTLPIFGGSRLIAGVVNIVIQHWRQPEDENDARQIDEIEPPMTEAAITMPPVVGCEDGTETTHSNTSGHWETESPAEGTNEVASLKEGMSSSYVKCEGTVDSAEIYDSPSDEESQAWDSVSTQSNIEITMVPWTPPKEARAPPIHGYPRANKPYQRDVPPPNAIRPDDSASVWDRRGDERTARILFDSGAEPNFASREKVEALHFSPLPLNEDDMEMCETLGGHEGLATHYVSMDIEIKNLNLKRHSVSFFVVDSNRIEIILGQNYMGSKKIWEKKVEKKGSMRAYAIFSKKSTPGKEPLPLQCGKLADSLSCRADQVHARRESALSKKSTNGRSNCSRRRYRSDKCRKGDLQGELNQLNRKYSERSNDCGNKLIYRVVHAKTSGQLISQSQTGIGDRVYWNLHVGQFILANFVRFFAG